MNERGEEGSVKAERKMRTRAPQRVGLQELDQGQSKHSLFFLLDHPFRISQTSDRTTRVDREG